MKDNVISLPVLVSFLILNTFFILINNHGFAAFAQAVKPVHVLIPANAEWRYHAATNQEDEDWKDITFDDSNWERGKAGFGYGDDDDRTRLDTMRGRFDKLMIRKKFEIGELDSIDKLYLYIRFDDAFIAYLNGHEIARSGVLQKGFVEQVDSHEAQDYELFTIMAPAKILHQGDNILAVIGFNRSLDSSDFSIEPVLAQIELENPQLPLQLGKDEWYADIEYLEKRLEDQSSYLLLEKFDYKKAFQQLKKDYREGVSGLEFAQRLQKLIAQIGDAHSGVEVEMDDIDDRYLPFILADTSVGVIAVNAGETELLERDYPLLVSIDGVPLDEWLAVAASYVPQASKQLIRYQALRQLRSIDRMRKELNLPESTFIDITLQSVDGLQHKPLRLKTRDHRLPTAKVDKGESGILGDNIGYLRISSMYSDAEEVVNPMALFKDTSGLIIDVRDNRGGHYDILQALYGFFIAKSGPPYVSNIAAYRLSPTFDKDHLSYRPTYRLKFKGWTKAQKTAINKALAAFRPEWDIPRKKFSEWHFMVLGKSPEFHQYHYKQPVVVLSNAASFSATDGFLGAFSDLPQVTIIGQPSGGGSGATQDFRLPDSGIEISLSSMASFRPNGKLYDGNGVEVDIPVKPEPSDYLGKSDAVLEKALSLLR